MVSFTHRCTFQRKPLFPHAPCRAPLYRVPFSVGILGAACGVMITGIQTICCATYSPCSPLIKFLASHNPKVRYKIHKAGRYIHTLASKIMVTRYSRSHIPMPLSLWLTGSGLLGECGPGTPGPIEITHGFLIPTQIIDPHDSGIAGSILLNLKPDGRVWNLESFLDSSGCIDRTEELTQAYFEYLWRLRTYASL